MWRDTIIITEITNFNTLKVNINKWWPFSYYVRQMRLFYTKKYYFKIKYFVKFSFEKNEKTNKNWENLFTFFIIITLFLIANFRFCHLRLFSTYFHWIYYAHQFSIDSRYLIVETIMKSSCNMVMLIFVRSSYFIHQLHSKTLPSKNLVLDGNGKL